MLQIGASRRVSFWAAISILAAICLPAAAQQSEIPVEYDERIYIHFARGNRWFVQPQSSQNWPGGRHGGDAGDRAEAIAFVVKGKAGGPLQHFDIVALEASVTTHEGYVRPHMFSNMYVYFNVPMPLGGEGNRQWWRLLREKGDGVVNQGDVVYLQNRADGNRYLSNIEDNGWLTCGETRCPLKFVFVETKRPKVVISTVARATDPDFVNDVVFVENPGSTSTQSVSQTWSLSETQSAQIGKESTKQWETGLSISTEYQALFFKGDVELSASYGEAVTEQRSEVMESNVQKSITGTYNAPPRGWAFHTLKIKIPYKVYDATTGGTKLQMRKFSGLLELSRGRVIEIPNKDENGNVVPVPLSDLQEVLQLYSAKDPDEVREILKPGGLLQQWQAKGYVTGGAAPAPTPSPMPAPSPAPNPSPSPMGPINVVTVPGFYQRNPVEDPWHRGRITVGANNNFVWTNSAGVSWTLTPDFANKMLRTGADNPYVNDGIRDFTLESNGTLVTGFRFNGELYTRGGDAGPAPNPSPGPAPGTRLSSEAVLGSYERTPVEDPWHQGRISSGPNGTLIWTNSAGVRWTLTPDLANKMLRTGADNPYVNDGIRDFTIEITRGQVTGFRFNGELYRRLP